jgi:hypothetical protein
MTERQEDRLHGRSIEVLAFGDTANELELAALDEARKFFGKDRQLEVVPSYKAFRPIVAQLVERADGKAYYATICVREP